MKLRRTENCKVNQVSTKLDGGFNHVSKLNVLKYKKAINGPDDKTGKLLRKSTNT